MQDRRSVRGALWPGLSIELVVEDGFDRTIGARADLDGQFRRGFEALRAKGRRQPDDAQTGPEALFGMRPVLQDQFAQRRRRRSDGAHPRG